MSAGRQALDRHLPEIAALIDPRQFDVITARDGVVVIQGGAGSGKTTVGLHRLAYLAHTFPDKFAPRRLAVVTHGAALAAYIGEVLPSLGTPFLFTARAARSYHDVVYPTPAVLIFGRESVGLPDTILTPHAADTVRILQHERVAKTRCLAVDLERAFPGLVLDPVVVPDAQQLLTHLVPVHVRSRIAANSISKTHI